MKTYLLMMLLGGMSLMAAVVGETPKLASEGVQVHGDWKIEVFEADGTKVSSVEFQNALVSPSILTSGLSTQISVGGIYVALSPSSGNGPCGASFCEIVPSDLNIGTTAASTNLVVTQTGTNFETLNLAGSLTATTGSTISVVDSWVTICGPTVAPATCRTQSPDSSSVLTRKTLSSGVTVTAGQIVQVTVQLTFS